MKTLLKKTNNTKISFVFLLGIIFAFSLLQIKNVNAESGESSSIVETKIINGNKSNSKAWPWMAYIEIDLGKWKIGRCGGTLVAPQWVLTAAHCVTDMLRAKVYLDRNNLEGRGGEVISVSRSFIHPEYNSKSEYIADAGFDIALLYLEKSSSIKPVTLENDFDFQREEGKSAKALGWGVSHEGSDKLGDKDIVPEELQEVELTIKGGSQCDNPYFPNNIICLGVYDKKAVCSGDSGGPLLYRDSNSQNWKQIGITSFGYIKGCTVEGAFNVFTQVDKYEQFINSTINGTTQVETPKDLLAKCVEKFSDYLGAKVGEAFPCGSGICQNTTGGRKMDIQKIFVLENNSGGVLEYFDNTSKQWHKISFSDIGYCE